MIERFFLFASTFIIIWILAKYLNKVSTQIMLHINAGRFNITVVEMWNLKTTTAPLITGLFSATIKGGIGFGLIWFAYWFLGLFALLINVLFVILLGIVIVFFESYNHSYGPRRIAPLHKRPIDDMLEDLDPLIGVLEGVGGIIGVVIAGIYYM